MALPSDTGFPFEAALRQQDFNFICEVKKASPSKGIIAEHFPYLDIAKEYEVAGAAAISVLTEPDFFKGDKKYLQEIASTVKIPVLRKDFIIDEYPPWLRLMTKTKYKWLSIVGHALLALTTAI